LKPHQTLVTKTGNHLLWNLWKIASKICSNLLNYDSCVKTERGLCEGTWSQQKNILVSNNSSPSIQKLILKIRTKTGKTKYFLYLIYVFLLSEFSLNLFVSPILYLLGKFTIVLTFLDLFTSLALSPATSSFCFCFDGLSCCLEIEI